MADTTRELVLRTREELLERGADAGAETIHWHLPGQLAVVPSVSSIYRLRTDIVDVRGHVSLRYLGHLRHLKVGWRYRGERVYLYIIDDEVGMVSQDGELIGNIALPADRDYHPRSRSTL